MILRASNTERLIKGKVKTYISSEAAAASGTFTAESISGFAIGQRLIVGQVGEERSEILRVHASTAPSGSTITLAANSTYRHEVGTPIYFTDYDQVEFSRATTETGTKTVLATTTLTVDSMDTIYDDTTNTTGYGFYRFKNSDSTTYSGYSDPIPYAGYDRDAASNIFDQALVSAGEEISSRLRYEHLFQFLNDYIYLAREKNFRWSRCKVFDYRLDNVSTGDWEFSLPSDIARDYDPSSILSIKIRGFLPLKYINKKEWDQITYDLRFTTLASTLADSDVTATLTQSYDFAESGTVYINGDAIAYTGNTEGATGTLTGVTGIVTGGHASGSYVFQNQTTGDPIYYTFPSAGYIRVWPVASSTADSRSLFISYYKLLPAANSLGDKILLNDVYPAIRYVAYRIKKFVAGGSLSIDDPEYKEAIAYLSEVESNDMTGEPVSVSIG